MKKVYIIFILGIILLIGIISCSPSGEGIAEKICDCQEQLLKKTLFTRSEIENQADSCRKYYVDKYLVNEKKELKFAFERAESLITESRKKILIAYEEQIKVISEEINLLYKGVAEQKYISPQTMNNLYDSILNIVCKNHKVNNDNAVILESFTSAIVVETYSMIEQKFYSQPSYVLDLTQMIYSIGNVNEYKQRTNTNTTVSKDDKVLFYVVLPNDFTKTFKIPPLSFDAAEKSEDKGMYAFFGISTIARLRCSFNEDTENRVVLDANYLSSLDKRNVVYGKIIDKENDTYKIFDAENKRVSSQATIWRFEVSSYDDAKVETSVIIDRIKNPEILKDNQGLLVLFSGNYKGYNQMSYSTSFTKVPISQALYFDNCEIIGIYKVPNFFDNIKKNIWGEYVKYCNSNQINIEK